MSALMTSVRITDGWSLAATMGVRLYDLNERDPSKSAILLARPENNSVREEVDVVAVRCQAAVGRVVVVGERPARRDHAVAVEAQQLEAPAIRYVSRVKVVLRVGGDAAKCESALPSQPGSGRGGSDQVQACCSKFLFDARGKFGKI